MIKPRNRIHFLFFLAGLILFWTGSVLLSLHMGVVYISMKEIFSGVMGQCFAHEYSDTNVLLLCSLRLPRVLLSSLSGFVLSLCGTVMQGLFRTPLADPYLLGILGGSTSGAALVIFLGLGSSFLYISLGSFIGGIFAVFLVLLFAVLFRKTASLTNDLLIAGIAFSSLFSAITSCLLMFSSLQTSSQPLLFWMLGSLSRSSFHAVLVLTIAILCLSPMIFFSYKSLNLLSLGDEMASHLGISPLWVRISLLMICTLLTALVVASVGPIGFIGLLVPHISRFLVGPNHRRLLITSAILGAILLTITDTISRVLFAPMIELPIGIVTAAIGSPFLLFLLFKRRPSL